MNINEAFTVNGTHNDNLLFASRNYKVHVWDLLR